MTRRSHLTRILAVAGMAALGFSPLAGQGGPIGADSRDVARAKLLVTNAESLLENTDCWSDAAEMFERAARLFEPGDAQAFSAMRRAAQLRYYTKDFFVALSLMEEAAELGAGSGLDAQAANAYIDAAALASTMKDRAAQRLLEKAVKLAKSPRLTGEQRLHLEERLRDARSKGIGR